MVSLTPHNPRGAATKAKLGDEWTHTPVKGHILVESEKMSKQMGNFILLDEAVRGQREMEMGDKVKMVGWTADATRVALANGGDGLDDANFAIDVADSAVMRLFNELKYVDEVLALPADAAGAETTNALEKFVRDVFVAQIDKCIDDADSAFAQMRYRDALVASFFNMFDARDTYRKSCALLGVAPNKTVQMRFVVVLAIITSPICPHFCEQVWRFKLQREGSVMNASWPTVAMPPAQRQVVLDKARFLATCESRARQAIEKHAAKAGAAPAKGVVFLVGVTVPPWHQYVVDFLKDKAPNPKAMGADAPASGELMKAVSAHVKAHPTFVKEMKGAVKVAADVYADALANGPSAYVTVTAFDEVELITQHASVLVKALGVVESVSARVVAKDDKNADVAKPGWPLLTVVS